MKREIKACGIDFGTSNSAIAVAVNGEINLARIEGNNTTIPSAIFYPDEGQPEYGRNAVISFSQGCEGRFMRSFKRSLGTNLLEYGAIINGRLKKYDHIIAGFIRYIKNNAEKSFCIELDNVVIGRPVHFVDGDKTADNIAQLQLESIARIVGFKNIKFQYEPIAAAFAHEQKLISEKLALVVDIGGGTSDFTIIKLGHKIKGDRKNDILANAGIRIGGNDFDKDLSLKSFMPQFGIFSTYGKKKLPMPLNVFHDISEWSKINSLYTPATLSNIKQILKESHSPEKLKRFLKTLELETGHHILEKVEETKIGLTHKQEYTTTLDFIENNFCILSKRKEFDNAIKQHINNISKTITECLTQTELKEKDIDLIILTGGTTDVPILKETIKKRFPSAEISEENKLSSVALGLGFDSLNFLQ